MEQGKSLSRWEVLRCSILDSKTCHRDLYLRLDVFGGGHHVILTGVWREVQIVDSTQTVLVNMDFLYVSCDLECEKGGWRIVGANEE